MMNETQIKIDKVISAMMRRASEDLDDIMERDDISNELKIRYAGILGARWSAMNEIRNYVFNMNDPESEYSRVEV